MTLLRTAGLVSHEEKSTNGICTKDPLMVSERLTSMEELDNRGGDKKMEVREGDFQI